MLLLRKGMVGMCSPQLSQDLVWFLRAWSNSYLLYDESYYPEVSVLTNDGGLVNTGFSCRTVNAGSIPWWVKALIFSCST